MLQLLVQSRSAGEVVVEVHGWISGDNVPLLARECAAWRTRGCRLTLDLDWVRFIDAEGAALLGRLQGSLQLRGGSTFVRTLLLRHGLRVGTSGAGMDTEPGERG